MARKLCPLLGELQKLALELAALPADDPLQQRSVHARAKAWGDAAVVAAQEAGSLDGEQAEECCRALLAAAEQLEIGASLGAALQGSGQLTRWLPISVKLLHGCAALASTCRDAAAPAVAALWRSGRIVLAHSTGTIEKGVCGLAAGGQMASALLAAINSHAKPFVELLECSSSSPQVATHAPLQFLVVWLLAAARALSLTRSTHGLTDEYAVCLGRVLEMLLFLSRIPRSQLGPQMHRQQHVALCASVLDIALPQLTATAAGLSLPAERRRAWCTWPHAALCAAVVTTVLLLPALSEMAHAASRDRGGPESAKLARLLQSAASLVQRMPAGEAGDAQHASQLLALLLTALQCQSTIIRAAGVAAGQLQQARQLLPLLPRLASLMTPEGRGSLALGQVCSTAAQLLHIFTELATSRNTAEGRIFVRSLEDIPEWADASTTALRMLPVAAEAAQQAAQQAEQQAAAGGAAAVQWKPTPDSLAFSAGLFAEALGTQCLAAVTTGSGGDASPPVPVISAALAALVQLHSTACRAAAWGANSDARRWLPSLAREVHFDGIVCSPADAACMLWGTSLTDFQSNILPDEAKRQLEALAVAHIATLSALAGPDPTAGHWLRHTAVRSASEGLLGVFQCGPAALAANANVQPLFITCVKAIPQEDGVRSDFLRQFALRAGMSCSPLLPALLLGTEAWEELGASGLASNRDPLTPVILSSVLLAIQRLEQAATSVLQEAASSQSSSEGEARLLATLGQQFAALESLAGGPARGQDFHRFRRQLWPAVAAARPLAATLLDWWRRPEAQQAAALEVAQAAARRSCAYLRCANLGGEGGPAAGEGVGSMRCSACRAVWYCGTACSHADWRAGHRRVCKALGAARAAEKERRQQAAAGAAPGGAKEEGG